MSAEIEVVNNDGDEEIVSLGQISDTDDSDEIVGSITSAALAALNLQETQR